MRTDTHTDRQMNKSAYRVTFQINLDATKKKKRERPSKCDVLGILHNRTDTGENPFTWTCAAKNMKI